MDTRAQHAVHVPCSAPGATEPHIPALPSNRTDQEVYGAAAQAAFFVFDDGRTSAGAPFAF